MHSYVLRNRSSENKLYSRIIDNFISYLHVPPISTVWSVSEFIIMYNSMGTGRINPYNMYFFFFSADCNMCTRGIERNELQNRKVASAIKQVWKYANEQTSFIVNDPWSILYCIAILLYLHTKGKSWFLSFQLISINSSASATACRRQNEQLSTLLYNTAAKNTEPLQFS